MPIYRGTTPLKAYKGDMQPVNVYRGSTKVAGWHLASYSGTSPLTVDCDYNVPPDALVIDGKCVQTGTPSPDSPAPISTITGDMTITGADGDSSDTATVALGSNACASLPDGTHDSYDAVTGVLTFNPAPNFEAPADGGANNVYDLVVPYKSEPSLDVTKKLRDKKVSAKDMVRMGERFFTSLGLDPLPETFWQRSLFEKPQDRDVVCHASAPALMSVTPTQHTTDAYVRWKRQKAPTLVWCLT